MALLRSLLNLYVILIIARIILSYFPIHPGTTMAQLFSVLYRATEPVLGPARRIIPPIGMIDISPMIVILAIEVVSANL